VLITYYKKAEKNPDIFKQTITNKQDPTSGSSIQNIKPSETLVLNSDYTIEELINRMIINSDNDAYNDLVDNINSNDIVQTYKDLDVDISKAFTNPNGNILNVKDYASFFRILYNASYLDKNYSEKALKLLSQTRFKQGLVAGLPQNILSAHKFGERQYRDTGQKQLHDCGIVYLPGKPYLLCIMSRGNNFDNLTETIKSISATVYTALDPQNWYCGYSSCNLSELVLPDLSTALVGLNSSPFTKHLILRLPGTGLAIVNSPGIRGGPS